MSLTYSFARKRVLITGGGQGVGRQLVQRLHDDGALVLALDKNTETISQLQKEFPNVKAVAVDLTDWDATKTAIESFGAIDHVVNNAGMVIFQSFMDVTKELANLHFDVNVLSCINVVQTAAKGMIERSSSGAFVNISSIGVKGAMVGTSMYSASKSAMEMLTKSMSVELGPHNIRANCILPGVIDTPMSRYEDPANQEHVGKMISKMSIKRKIDPNEICDLVLFLLSPLSGMITGKSIVIDGGFLASFV